MALWQYYAHLPQGCNITSTELCIESLAYFSNVRTDGQQKKTFKACGMASVSGMLESETCLNEARAQYVDHDEDVTEIEASYHNQGRLHTRQVPASLQCHFVFRM